MDNNWYSIPKPSIAVDIVVMTTANRAEQLLRSVPSKGLLLLLTKSNPEVYTNKWVLPGGFVKLGQSLRETCLDKLKTKSGVSQVHLEQVHAYGDDINRDPRGHVISIGYMALIDSPESVEINQDTAEWFWVDQMENGEIKLTSYRTDKKLDYTDVGFDHMQIIKDTIKSLADKIMYSNAGFYLLPKEFTINELQQCFELVCNREIPGFRRSIETKIQEVQNKFRSNGYRPARLYQIKSST